MSDSRLVATVVVDNSQAIPAAKAAGDAMVGALSATEIANEKLRIAEERLSAAMQTRIAASKQVEFSVAAQAAAGKPLEEQLVRLQEQYARLNAAMTNSVRGGRGVPVELAAEAARVRGEIASLETQLGRSEVTAAQAAGSYGTMSLALAGVGLAAIATTRFISDSVRIAAESEAVTRKLTAALIAQGDNTEQTRKRILDYSVALERQTGMSHDSITAVQTQLILLSKLSGSALEEATQATLDFAVGTGRDAETAVLAVAKAIDGHTAGLQKLGIEYKATGDKAKDAAGVTAALEARFKGQAVTAAEGAGESKKLEQAWRDLKETVGNELLPAVIDLETGLTEIFHLGVDLSKSENPLVKFFSDIGSLGILPAIKAYREWRETLNENDSQASINAVQLKEETAVLATMRARIEELTPIVQDYTDKVGMGYSSYASKLRDAQAELDKLKTKELEQQGLVTSMQNRNAGGMGPNAPAADDTPEKDPKGGEGAKAHALAVAAEMQRNQRAASKSFVEDAIREGSTTDELAKKIDELTAKKKLLTDQAIEEHGFNEEAATAKMREAEGLGLEIEALRKEAEAKRQALAAHRQVLEAQLAEHAQLDPLRQKLADLALQRLELSKAIILQKGATGELTDADHAQIAAIDAQINATKGQISEQDKLKEATKRSAEESARAYEQAGVSIARSMGTAFGMVATGQEKMSTAVKREAIALTNTLVELAIKQAVADRAVASAKISNAAGVAGANEFAATSTMGPVGLAIGAAAAGAVISAILSEKSFLAAAGGGKLRGGIPGIDSIPVMAMQDENVLDTRTNRKLEAFLDGPGGLQTSPNSFPAIGDIHVHLPPSTNGVGPSVAEVGRMISDRVIPAIIQAANAGKLDSVLNSRSR